MNSDIFKTEIIKTHPYNHARVAKIITPHGEIITPAFMPVGTRAFVNHLTPAQLLECGSQIILGGNTYHMLCTPGLETLQALGGMHRFMNWPGPMLTDSGGFQVFSLSKNQEICRIDEEGAKFRIPDTNKTVRLNAESSIQAQKIIGADIIMAFDQCTPNVADKHIVQQALQRTHRWLLRSKTTHDRDPYSIYGNKQALFGIIQGGYFRDLCEESACFIVENDLDGIAIGGETIGFDMQKTGEIIDWIRPLLPKQKTRYAMGVGLGPQDLLDVVAKGIDIFDCVAPTRNARHGALYFGEITIENQWPRFISQIDRGRILIKKTSYARDESPIMTNCSCYTCKNFTRAYLHYLFKIKASLYHNLACIHNIHVMHQVCNKMRECILSNHCSKN